MVEATTNRMSRRQVLTRTAAGAAVVWTTPVVTSFGLTPAAAGSAGFCPVPNLSQFQGELNYKYAGQLLAGTDLTENDASPYSNDEAAFVFNESGPVEIPAGGYNSETAFIPGGTRVCSILVHGSAVTGTVRYRMTLSMPPGVTIVGYDGHTANLNNSDPLFAVPGVDYSGAARQHEWTANANGNGDYFGQVGAAAVEIRMAVNDCCTDQGRIFVTCP